MERAGIRELLPERAKGPRKLQISYLDKDVDSSNIEKWTWSRDFKSNPPRGDQKRRMFAIVLRELTSFIISNHVYRFNG